MPKFLCIGDVILDIIPSVFPIEKNKVLMDGETFVDTVTFQRGGCGGNFVCVLKSIFPAAQVEFVSRIGADSNGDFLIKEMEKYGVVPIFTKDPEVSTQITIAVAYQDGERHFITHLGGLENFQIGDISEDMFEGVDHLAFRGPWFAEKLLVDCEIFLKQAVDRKIPISMDLGFDPFWNRDTPEDPNTEAHIARRKSYVKNALKHITYLFGNEQEFLQLMDTDSLDKAIPALFKLGVANIVLHRGSKGAAVITLKDLNSPESYEFIEIPAAKVEVINPVGSGDTFDSILIAQITEGKTLVQAAVLASAGAAYSLQSHPGTKITLGKVHGFVKNVPELAKML